MKTVIQVRYLPFYILTVSLFVGSFIIQYLALAVFLGFYMIQRPVVKWNAFFQWPLVLFLFVLFSYLVNLLTGRADAYSILFWFFSYLPPFLLTWLILAYGKEIDVYKVYGLYKKLVYLQTILLIFSAIKYRTFVVGDYATGTVGDANWVAFHICVVIIYEVVRLIHLSKTGLFSLRKNLASITEVFYFFIVLIIPESTANLGFLFIILGLLFFFEFMRAKINVQRSLVFVICAVVGFYLVSDTLVYKRIEGAVKDLAREDTEANPNLFKVTIYKKLIRGEIYQDVNPLIGSGPATFTSRSSVMRMPEERFNRFPIALPYFKSEAFRKHISPVYAEWRKSGEGYGNFASPQTTVISIAIELGIIGLLIFSLYFVFIGKTLNKKRFSTDHMFLTKFGKYITAFFALSLFHLNFWEYPIVSFSYVTLVFLIIKRKSEPKTEEAV